MDLCFSPVGDAFRIRARMFSGIINSTTMDYHHAWPAEALIGVADRFLEEIEFDTPELRNTISTHMAFCHVSIDEANTRVLAAERRNNYVTPTSFLGLIKFYKKLLGEKRGKIVDQINRLTIGLQTMDDTNKVVADLSIELDETMKIVEMEVEATGKLIAVVDAEAEEAAKEEAVAKVQEDATNEEAAKAQGVMDNATKALETAIPLIKEAEEAVNCLNKPAIDELKSFGSPSSAVLLVVKAILILYKQEKKNFAWDNGKKMMKDPNAFLIGLKSFNKEDIPDWVVKEMDTILLDPTYNFASM
jgi:dynein heavy chain